MAISIDDFKKAFANKASDNGLQDRLGQVEDSLKQLTAAVKQSAKDQQPTEGFSRVLKRLVQRFADISAKPADAGANAATELDDILRQSEAAIKGLNGAAGQIGPAVSTAGPIAQAPPPPAPKPPPAQTPSAQSPPAAPTKTETLQTGVAVVPDYEGVRTRITKWFESNISKDRARAKVNLSNLREVIQDANVMEAVGAEILAIVKVGPAGKELERFTWDQSFQASNKWWEAAEGTVPAIVEVIDAKTGDPIKAAMVRLQTGKAYPTDADGRAKMELPPSSNWTVEITASGYVTGKDSFYTSERSGEGTANALAPVDADAVERPQVTILIVDITDGTPLPNATVKLGALTKTTDAAGVVSVNLVPGEYSYSVTAQDFVAETGKLDIRAGKDGLLTETIGLRPVGAEDIYIRVLNSKTKKPVPEPMVRIGSQQENTDSHGEARFVSIAFGEHRLGLWSEGFKPYGETIKHNKKSGTAFREFKLEPGKP